MKILLDHNLDWRLFRALPDHEVKSTLKMEWEELENGDLLDAAEKDAFAVMLTADKSIQKQQTIAGRSIALVVLRAPNNKLKTHLSMIQEVIQALLTIEAGQVVEIFHPDLKPK